MKYNRIRRIVRARNGSQIPKFQNAGILDMIQNPYMAPNSIAVQKPSAIDVANATLLPLDFSRPPSKFQQTMQKFGQKAGQFIGQNQNMISQGADMFGNFMNSKVTNSENAEKGFMAANMATDILGKVNPTLGMYSKIGLAGFKTFNSIFGKKTQDFSADTNMLAQIGNSYGDSSKDILDASSNAGKKYGLFSNRARRKANRAINDAREQQNTMIDIANEAMDQRNAIRDINYLTYQNDINGGWGYNYMRVAKSGMKLSDKIDLVKKRRTANNFINVDTKEIEQEPIIVNIEEFKEGGNLPELWEPIIDDISDYWEPIIDDVEYYQEGGKLENDQNIVFEIPSKQKTRTIEQLIEEAKKQNPRFIQRMSEPLRYIRINSKDANGKEFWSHATHEMTYQNNEVYPMIQEIKGKLRLFNDPLEAYKNAKANNNVLKFNSEEEAKLFAKSGIDDNGEYYGYKLGWPDFFNTSPVGIKEEYSIDRFRDGGKTKEELETPEIEETTQKNIIPEGALHKNKHHMEHSEGLTQKGIPVVDNNGEQQAEIELNEIIFTLEVTKKLEELYKEGTDEAAIEAGKLLVKEILFNTDDRTSLINKIQI